MKKVNAGQKVTKEDLLPLVLSPLMSGELFQKERIRAAYEITRKAAADDAEMIKKVEAVVYIMADKFLDSKDMEELKEEIKMTRIGKMLYEDGRTEGKLEGKLEGMILGVVRTCKNFGALKGDAVKQIMEEFGKTHEEAQKEVEKYWENESKSN